MLQIMNLRPGYGGRPVCAPVSVTLQAGQALLLLGASGSGKSSLLHCLGGLARPVSGEARLEGAILCSPEAVAPDRFRGRRVGFVHQRPALNPALTLTQNLLMACYCAGLPQDRKRAADLLERLGLTPFASRKPGALSYGQQQRAAAARAVMNRPALLLCDEPTSALDDASAEAAARLLCDAAAEAGAALIIATHDSRLKNRFPAELHLAIAA